MAGLPLHLVLDDRAARNSKSLAVIDLRRVRRDSEPEFLTVVCPRKFGMEWLRQCLAGQGIEDCIVREAFVDGERLREAIEPAWPAILITCVGAVPLLPGSGFIRLPTVLDSRSIMQLRIGLAQSTMQWRHARAGPQSVRTVWNLSPAECYVLGPDPQVNFDPPSVLCLDCLPEPDDFELIVYSLHEDAFRTWVPRVASHAALTRFLSRICGIDEVCLLWPRFAPCLPGGACHVVAVPEVMQNECFAIVDSRRVFPTAVRQALRLVQLPDRVSPAHFGDDLCGHETRLLPGSVAVDGLPISGTLHAWPGLSVVTVFPQGTRWLDCVFDNWRIARSHIGCCLHLQTSTTTTTTFAPPAQWNQDCFGTSSTTTPFPEIGAAAQAGVEVRVVMALPGTRCRSVVWHTSHPLVHAIWPLVTDFVQHLPWETVPTLLASHRFVRDEIGRPVVLLAVEHPDFLSCCNAWIYVQDGTFQNFRLVAIDKRMSAASFRRTHCQAHMSWDLLLDGCRASDTPRWHNAALITLTPDWRSALTEPLAGLFAAAKDLHFVQFPLVIPPCVSHVDAPSSEALRTFVREWDTQLSLLASFNGYLPDARYVSVAFPDHGLCCLRLVHQLTPSVHVLRQLISEVWPWMSRADVLDCQEVIDDGCLFLVQYPARPSFAFFCT